jgi:AhpD family alkylhydroperoxidase
MVAVSRVNACSGCTIVHERWALRAGVTTAELEAIGLGDLTRLDPRSRAAIVYAAALAEGRFRTAVDHELLTAVESHLTSRELRSVEAVARLITFANLVTNGLRTARRRRAPATETASD